MIDNILQRYGLCILHIDGFPLTQVAVIGIGHLLGAFFGTDTAGNALFHIHIAWMLCYFDFKISFFSVNTVDFGQGKQFNINVPADLDQFR